GDVDGANRTVPLAETEDGFQVVFGGFVDIHDRFLPIHTISIRLAQNGPFGKVDQIPAPPFHLQSRISGISWPWAVMYCRCSTSLSFISWMRKAPRLPSWGSRLTVSITRSKRSML